MKLIKDMLKLGGILALYAGVSCAALALVYAVTKPTIDGLAEKQLQESLSSLFPAADAFEPTDSLEPGDAGVTLMDAYLASADGVPIGMAIRAKGKSYGGDALVLVGVGQGRKIVGVRILELKDTPGLGANATSPTYFVDRTAKTTFPGQFKGKSLDDKFVVKEDVVAITASTITSKAIARIIKAAGQAGATRLEALAPGGK